MAFSRDIRRNWMVLPDGVGTCYGFVELTLELFTFLISLFSLGDMATSRKIKQEGKLRASYRGRWSCKSPEINGKDSKKKTLVNLLEDESKEIEDKRSKLNKVTPIYEEIRRSRSNYLTIEILAKLLDLQLKVCTTLSCHMVYSYKQGDIPMDRAIIVFWKTTRCQSKNIFMKRHVRH